MTAVLTPPAVADEPAILPEPEPGFAPTVAPPRKGDSLPAAPAPVEDEAPPERRRRRWWRWVLVAIAAVVGLVVLWDRVVGDLVFQQRQRHLAAEFEQASAEIGSGQAVAVVQAPDIGLNVMVIEGDSIENLRSGPAHQSGSALPGEPGTMVILGHAHAYGGPFGDIGRLAPGNIVYVQARNGPIVGYKVAEVVTEDVDAVLDEDEDELSRLVLVTGRGGWRSSDRVAVIALAAPVVDEPEGGPNQGDPRPVDRGVPFGPAMIVADLALLAAGMSWVFLRHRVSIGLRIAVVSPMAVLALVGFLLQLDTVLPALR